MSVILALFLTFSSPSQAQTDASKSVTIDTIVSVWRMRQAHASAFDFRGWGTQFRPARMVRPDELDPGARPETSAGFAVPDTSFNVRFRLAEAGKGRARLEFDNKILSLKDKGFIAQRVIEVVDAGVRKVHFPVGNLQFPLASFQKADPSRGLMNAHVMPLLLVYRALGRYPGFFDAGRLKVTNEKERVNDRTCLILIDGDNALWVDPERAFVPVRIAPVGKKKAVNLTTSNMSQILSMVGYPSLGRMFVKGRMNPSWNR